MPTAVADQILKRGALAWEVGAVPAPVLEGDYSTWAIYNSFDEPDTVDGVVNSEFAVFNRIETMALLVGVSENTMKSYTISSKSVSAALASKPGWPFDQEAYTFTSAYGTYMVTYDLIQ
ncbi:hypothetical protein ES703_65506 [subsurface metagenome]